LKAKILGIEKEIKQIEKVEWLKLSNNGLRNALSHMRQIQYSLEVCELIEDIGGSVNYYAFKDMTGIGYDIYLSSDDL